MRTAAYSPCRRYRYTLWRTGLQDGVLFTEPGPMGDPRTSICNFVCLNPSTATDEQDDPTIRRCWGFAQAWGFGTFCMTNLFAWRDTDPERMKAAPEPVGAENDGWLREIAEQAGLVVVGWGRHGSHLGRAEEVRGILRGIPLHALATNDDGSPQHPLYLPRTATPAPWRAP